MATVLSLHSCFVLFASFAMSSCKNDSFLEQPVNPIVKESKARELYNSFDEKYIKEKPYTYMSNKYTDIALEYLDMWNEDVYQFDINKKQELLTDYTAKSFQRLENAKLCSTPEDKFFNDLYFEMIEELNTFDVVSERITEADASSLEWSTNAKTDMMVSVDGECCSKLDVLYRKEFLSEGNVSCEKETSDAGARRINRSKGVSIWLKDEIRYRNYDGRCPNITMMRKAMREWEKAMNNVRKFVEIEDNGWNRFTWGLGTNYHIALSDTNEPGIAGESTVGAVPWALIHMKSTAGWGSYLHEIGHSLCLLHEHERQDRDDYIIVLTDNIDPKYKSQFTKGGKSYGPFDIESIMMYGSTAFAKPGAGYTMTRKDGTTWWAQRDSLSTQDKINIKQIYN